MGELRKVEGILKGFLKCKLLFLVGIVVFWGDVIVGRWGWKSIGLLYGVIIDFRKEVEWMGLGGMGGLFMFLCFFMVLVI